jgi:hypothetical protein
LRFNVPGATVTVATGTWLTLIAADPACPSLVAVIVTGPVPTAVTNPLPVTVARFALVVDHVTTRPVSALPAASRGVAVNCSVWPTTRFAELGVTPTDATGTADTVTLAEPVCPSLVAVIVAVPVPCAVTNPLPFTVATPLALVDHTIGRAVSTLPAASRSVAVNCPVCPAFRFNVAGATVTVATGAWLTLIAADPVCPSLVAVIVAVPVPCAVTNPLPFTVTTLLALVDHTIVRPVSTLPAASRGVAVNCPVCPAVRFTVAGATVTVATGT